MSHKDAYYYFIIEGSPSNRMVNEAMQTSVSTLGWNKTYTKCILKTGHKIPDSLLELRAYTYKEIQAIMVEGSEWDQLSRS